MRVGVLGWYRPGKGAGVEEKGSVFFQTRVREVGDIPVVELEGEVDLSTSPRFKEIVYQLVDSGKRDIVIDLDGLDFMDSTGLGVLVAVLKRTSMEGGRIRLVCSKRSIMKVFSITGLDKVFTIYDNLQRCLQD
ncbi:MAG: STAS domain-containing protein [Actinobacteria bacterium]|nr:STAS domain-containing protein [Actinomycetota bacterium]